MTKLTKKQRANALSNNERMLQGYAKERDALSAKIAKARDPKVKRKLRRELKVVTAIMCSYWNMKSLLSA